MRKMWPHTTLAHSRRRLVIDILVLNMECVKLSTKGNFFVAFHRLKIKFIYSARKGWHLLGNMWFKLGKDAQFSVNILIDKYMCNQISFAISVRIFFRSWNLRFRCILQTWSGKWVHVLTQERGKRLIPWVCVCNLVWTAHILKLFTTNVAGCAKWNTAKRDKCSFRTRVSFREFQSFSLIN